MWAVLLMSIIGIIEALHCDKEFNYYDSYGNGFVITCQGITQQYLHLLENITVSQEISLKIENSTLTDVSSTLFHNVKHLRCLLMENSTFTFPRNHSVFQLLNDLEHLVIVNTPIFVTKQTFVGLENVKELILTNNKLEKIEKGSFKSLPSLRILRVTDNQIKDIGDLPLCEVRDLRTLNLSRNVITSLGNQNFYCRNSNQGMDINFNGENIALNIPKNDFISITDFALELSHIDLSFNQIREVGRSFAALKSLRVIKLEGNKLSHLNNSDFETLDDLEEVHLSNNLLETIGDKVFHNKENLEYLDLSRNKLVGLSVNKVPILKYINLGYNKLSNISFVSFPKLESLRTLILCNNYLVDIQHHFFKRLVSLELLDLANNKIILSDDSFSDVFELKGLFLRNNSITTLPDYVFDSLTNLRTLDLSQNKLESIKHNNTFRNLKDLEVLNISYNLLQDLDYALLEPLDNLHVLDIGGNRLKYIQYESILSNLPLLSVLNIKANYLSCDLLFKIIKFLKQKNVTYTMVEKFDYEKENVAGIYCTSEIIPEESSSIIPGESRILFNFSIVVVTFLIIIVICIALFKIHIYLKRRKYRADEFELIRE